MKNTRWRLVSRLSVIVLAILVVIIVTLIQQNRANAPTPPNTNQKGSLQGAELGLKPAPGFHLRDQNDKEVSFKDYKGKTVVLTFLHTACTDYCRPSIEKLETTLKNLDKDSENVVILAISTDPDHDTVESAKTFSENVHMQDKWHFLVGKSEELTPIWNAYNILIDNNLNSTQGLFIVDKQSRQRLFLSSDFTPDQLTNNLRILSQEESPQ